MSQYSIPCLKSLVEFCSVDKKIYFFNRPGVAIEMDDVSGFIETVCRLMNGENNFHQLQTILYPLYPKETSYLESLLTTLDNEYLLEDLDHNHKGDLSAYDIKRWSRNIEFFGAHCKANDNKYVYQEKLKSTKVTIFGLGGIGSNVLFNLAAMGVCHITVVDFDLVDLSNLNRQIIYYESDVGKLKSEIAKQRISKFSETAKIEFINKKICCCDDIEEIISGQDFVISAIDQPRDQIMDWFNNACVKQAVPFLCGALDSRIGICYTIIPGKTGCIECWKTSARSSALMFQKFIQHKDFVHSVSPNVAIMPLISIVSGLMSNEFLKIITGIAAPQSLGQLCAFDFSTSEVRILESWDKNPVCSVCQKD